MDTNNYETLDVNGDVDVDVDREVETIPLEMDKEHKIRTPKTRRKKKIKKSIETYSRNAYYVKREPILLKPGGEIESATLQDRLVDEDKLLLELERDKFNNYASKKSVSQGLFNTSVIQSQIGLVVSIFSNGLKLNGFAIATIALISASFALQVIIMFMIGILMRANRVKESRGCGTNAVNDWITFLSGIALILNIAITATSVSVYDRSNILATSINGTI